MRLSVLLLVPMLWACANDLPEHIALQPQAQTVEFAMEPPSSNAYKLLGKVSGEAASKDSEVAQEAAKNDLRNKAAALGATVVTIDENVGALVPLTSITKVKLVGRAYKSVD